MLDRDALATAREIRAALDALIVVLEPARARLREWSGAGLPSGAGESSIGSDRHADPVLRAIQAAEKRDKFGNHVGWRSTDPCLDTLRKADADLQLMSKLATSLAKHFTAMTMVPKREELAAEGCIFCDMVRLPVDAASGKLEHKCDHECAGRDHRHPNGHQDIYSRRAPRPPEGSEPVRDLPRCSWHWHFAGRHGVDAPPAIALWHLDHPASIDSIPKVPTWLLREHGLGPTTERATA